MLSVFDRRVWLLKNRHSHYIFIYLTLTNRNFVHEEMKSGLNTGIVSCLRYSSLSSSLLCKYTEFRT